MTNPLVSICCPTYNHEKFVEEVIRSIWNQDYQNIEIIAIDDGSNDSTYATLSNLSKISPFPMKVLTQQNSGNIPANINKTIINSQGELIIFLSLDDKLLPNKVGLLVKEIQADKNLQMIVPSNCVLIDDFSNENGNSDLKIAGKDSGIFRNEEMLEMEKNLGGSFYIQGCLFKKSLIIDCGMFDEDMLGDDIVLRIKIFRYLSKNLQMRFKIIDEAVCCYRIHQNNIHKNRERQCSILYEVLERYFDGGASPALDDWIKGTIIHNIIHGSTLSALRLAIWDKKNKSKLKILIKVFPIFIQHQINIHIRQKKIISDLISLVGRFRRKKAYHRIYKLKIAGDKRGSLVALEERKNIPFKTRRVYYIFNTKECVKRGYHAHKNLKQVLVCVSGSCKILLDDGSKKDMIKLDKPETALFIKGTIWREIYDFSSDCVLMVLADKLYDEEDYLRNYEDFLKYIGKK